VHVSPKFAALAAAPFALVCLGVALHGFLSLGDIADPQQMEDARGFALFWLFLAGIAVASGVLSWRIMSAQQRKDGGDA